MFSPMRACMGKEGENASKVSKCQIVEIEIPIPAVLLRLGKWSFGDMILTCFSERPLTQLSNEVAGNVLAKATRAE